MWRNRGSASRWTMSDNSLEGLRDLAPPSLRTQATTRIVQTDEYKVDLLTANTLRLKANFLGTLALLLPMIVFATWVIAMGGPTIIAAIAIPMSVIAIVWAMDWRVDRLTWRFGDGGLRATGKVESDIEIGLFDIDDVYVIGNHYYFTASVDKLYTYPIRGYSRGLRRFYIPFSAFKSDEDRLYFESLFPDWKINRKRSPKLSPS
jgi:hypothetical protein